MNELLKNINDNLGTITAVLTGIAGLITAAYQYVKNQSSDKLEKGDRSLKSALLLMEALQRDNKEMHERLQEQMQQLEQQDRTINGLRQTIYALMDEIAELRRNCPNAKTIRTPVPDVA